jgi:hypothetical protein
MFCPDNSDRTGVVGPNLSDRVSLLVLDGPGGPSPARWIPQLGRRYDLHVVTDRPLAELAGMSPAQLGGVAQVYQVESRAAIGKAANAVGAGRTFGGVLTFSELAVEDAHRLANSWGLPATAPGSLAGLRSKLAQRRALAAAGVSVPAFTRVSNLAELRSGIARVGTPAVLKPEVGAGSMATFAIRKGDDVAATWTAATRAIENDPRADPDVMFILESELIGSAWHEDERFGDYVSVESYISGGVITHMGISDKLPLSPPFRENGTLFPSVLPLDRQELLLDAAAEAIVALGLNNTATHIEFKLTSNGPVVIEVNARVGGGVVEMVGLTTGLNLIMELAEISTGQHKLGALPLPRGHAAYFCPQPPVWPCRVRRAPSTAAILDIAGMVDVDVRYREGDVPDAGRGTASQLLGGYAMSERSDRLLEIFAELTSDRYFELEPIRLDSGGYCS